MPHPGKKNIRVVMAHTAAEPFTPVAELLKSEKNWEYIEYSGEPEDTWKQAVARSPDLTVFFFPQIGEPERRCIGRLLIGCRTRVFIITYSRPAQEIEGTGARVEVCVINGPESAHTAVFSLNRAIESLTNAQTKGASALERLTAPSSPLEGMIIAVGASTGGIEALETVCRGLSPDLPGIVVVQHMPPGFTKMHAKSLNDKLPFDVMEAGDNVHIKPGGIYIAPGDRHLTIKRRGSSFYTSLGGTEKVGGHCPSVDVLFNSVAAEAGAKAVGVILTGMGSDGAAGLLNMRRHGAFTIGQDRASSVVYGMPSAAFDNGAVMKQAALTDIPRLIQSRYPK